MVNKCRTVMRVCASSNWPSARFTAISRYSGRYSQISSVSSNFPFSRNCAAAVQVITLLTE